jgi:enamine deaminase RidA (YjgF/YER057c/UK114 family)
MKREIIRVEPLATYLEKYKAPASTVTKHGDTIYVSGSPPFDPKQEKSSRDQLSVRRRSYWINSSSVSKRRALLWKIF